MSKAYDSININMLTKAMSRISIPSQIINILLALNQERNNQVITAHGLTEPYPVLGVSTKATSSHLFYGESTMTHFSLKSQRNIKGMSSPTNRKILSTNTTNIP